MTTVKQLLREKSVLIAPPNKPFILKSGARSMHYVDIRLSALSWDGVRVLVDAICALEIKADDNLVIDVIAGVALGGCPLATMLGHKAYKDVLYVRSSAKDHGTGKLVEGPVKSGSTALLIEDVVTSGASTLGAIQNLEAVGVKVAAVVAVLDREQGGRRAIEAKCPFEALITLSELLAD